ncbi:general L-amino acid transport system permease protein AapQ [Roseibium sp. TrichSKD4]|uniref:amino acid ABC transporter permease n=1 Tax=Roseibium sp. TrichSKD4 TaxID=744980 RepID=UPI0001E56315|nr:amino acid ABC transporter permease [Roseibium sp. TrichSKD4]EFO33861.1 general L-amino acid transport system permease protein AapQ [Roseibium sp. TrichSKD4]
MSDTADAPPRASLLNDPKVRGLFYQVLLVAFLVAGGWFIVSNTAANLERQNISSGFDFLKNTAGFGISQTPIEYSETSSYGRAIVIGFLNTLLVAVFGIFFATIIGFVVGISRLSTNWVISKLAYWYVEIVRNVPLLLQILFWYLLLIESTPSPRKSVELGAGAVLNNRGFFLPKPIWGDVAVYSLAALIIGIIATFVIRSWARKRQELTGQQFPVGLTALGAIIGFPLLVFLITGLPVQFEYPVLKGFNYVGGQRLIPEFLALLFALSIYTAAFIAEIVRAGIQAVSHGQTEAAHALGLRNSPTLRLVVIPQAMRVMIPPMTSQYLNLTKNSSLAVAIAFPDLVANGQIVMNQSGRAIEIVGIWMVVYLSLSLGTSAFMNWYNKRMALVER